MNKGLFWTGITLQTIHLLGFLLIFLSSIDWSFINSEFIFFGGYIIFNIVSLIMIFVGAFE